MTNDHEEEEADANAIVPAPPMRAVASPLAGVDPIEKHGIVNEGKLAFLRAFAQVGQVYTAAGLCNTMPANHYRWMKTDPAYATAFEELKEGYTERLEWEADRRAVMGVQEPVIYKGVITDWYTKYSDRLLMFRLKGLRPQMYNEAAANGSINIKGDKVLVVFGPKPPEGMGMEAMSMQMQMAALEDGSGDDGSDEGEGGTE